jgi:hypothetical protein
MRCSAPCGWSHRDDFLPDRQTVEVAELEPVRLYDASGNEHWLRKRIGFLRPPS